MPQCHRCERVQATAELRRTPRGYVCKDNSKGTRCHEIARKLPHALRICRDSRGFYYWQCKCGKRGSPATRTLALLRGHEHTHIGNGGFDRESRAIDREFRRREAVAA